MAAQTGWRSRRIVVCHQSKPLSSNCGWASEQVLLHFIPPCHPERSPNRTCAVRTCPERSRRDKSRRSHFLALKKNRRFLAAESPIGIMEKRRSRRRCCASTQNNKKPAALLAGAPPQPLKGRRRESWRRKRSKPCCVGGARKSRLLSGRKKRPRGRSSELSGNSRRGT